MTEASAREASRASRRAGGCTRRAEHEARDAAYYYTRSAKLREQAAWLTARPDMWTPRAGYTPAALEQEARSWGKVADTFLRASFRHTSDAEFYRGLAASYRQIAARATARQEVTADA